MPSAVASRSSKAVWIKRLRSGIKIRPAQWRLASSLSSSYPGLPSIEDKSKKSRPTTQKIFIVRRYPSFKPTVTRKMTSPNNSSNCITSARRARFRKRWAGALGTLLSQSLETRWIRTTPTIMNKMKIAGSRSTRTITWRMHNFPHPGRTKIAA